MSLSLIDVLDHYAADTSRLSASRAGWQSVKCPWHNDRTASASVNLDKGAYRCHACDMRGDAIKVIERVEGLDYLGACQFAREVLGASSDDLPRTAKEPKRKRPSARQRLFD